MPGFSAAWLDLREEADKRSRDTVLLKAAAAHAAQKSNALIVDLGAGTGSGVRALQLHLQGEYRWRLVDGDADLLAEACKRCTGLQAEYQIADIASKTLLPIAGAHLVTASALLDLVSATWIDRLVADVTEQRCAFYASLNFDGDVEWEPIHSADGLVAAAFNGHQRRDKGFGPALGPCAANYVAERFRRASYDVCIEESPWILNGMDSSLTDELIDGITNAVSETEEVAPSQLAEWRAFRLAAAQTGRCRIGHQDFLALPA